MDSSSQLIRPLGPCEMSSAARHDIGFYNCVANTCRYLVPLASLGSRPISDVLETALANAVLALPSLCVGIVGQSTSKPYFVRLPSVNLEHHLEIVETPNSGPGALDASVLRVLENQHDQNWPNIEHRPPWKLVVLVRSPASEDGLVVLDAIFAVHHAIGDGRSSALFHTKLLGELNRRAGRPAQLSGSLLSIANDTNLGRPQEEIVKFSTSWTFLVRTLWRELGPAWLQGPQPTVPWTGKVVTREPCKTRLQLVNVPAVAAPRVLAACRANRTTLTPLLHALVLASLARHIPPDKAQAFCSCTPIDLRPFIERDSRTGGAKSLFGNFVTVQSHFFDASTIAPLRAEPSDDEIWKIAAGLRDSMKQHLDAVPKDDIAGLLSWVRDWRKLWLSKEGKPRQCSWEVSNVGSMLGGAGDGEGKEPAGRWQIQRSIMSQGASVGGAAISINVAGVAGGDLCIALGWQEGIVEQETVARLAEDLQAWLDRLGREETLGQKGPQQPAPK
ncbi:hypothetical protein VTK56DRAFT_8686 [Thermocarpiscus australiensis]